MTFDNWLDELENYGCRLERLLATFPTADPNVLVSWLEAAYNAGYEEGNKLIEEMGTPKVSTFRALTRDWPDTPEMNLFKAVWVLGSFLEDWKRAVLTTIKTP